MTGHQGADGPYFTHQYQGSPDLTTWLDFFGAVQDHTLLGGKMELGNSRFDKCNP